MTVYKSCSRCGKIHESGYKCYKSTQEKAIEKRLRSTRKWTDMSKSIREDCQYLCEVCRSYGVYNYDNLEVHHIIKVKDDPSKLLDRDNLICLCQRHHKMADNGEIGENYLREIVEKRENLSNK